MIKLIEDGNSQIQNKMDQIEKRKALISKREDKIKEMENSGVTKWEYEREIEELRISNNKLKELEAQLKTLQSRQEKAKRNSELPEVPIIREFLDQWEEKTINWYLSKYDEYVDFKKNEYAAKRKEMDLRSFQSYMVNRFSPNILNWSQWGKEWKSKMLSDISKDKQAKYIALIKRVSEKVGNIINAKNLTIGDNGEINGRIDGDLNSVYVETITAGGYNIQVFHFRVLIHVLKNKI